MNNTSIDRDIDFYGGEVERRLWDLRNCVPAREPAVIAQIDAARRVVAELEKYRDLLKP